MVQQARSASDLVASTLDALTSSHRSSSHHAAAGSGRRRGTVAAAPRACSPPPPQQQQQPMDQSKFNPGRVRVSRPEDVDAAPAAWAKQYGAAYGMEELKLSISHLTDVPPSAAASAAADAASCGAAGEEDSAGEEETRPCEAAV